MIQPITLGPVQGTEFGTSGFLSAVNADGVEFQRHFTVTSSARRQWPSALQDEVKFEIQKATRELLREIEAAEPPAPDGAAPATPFYDYWRNSPGRMPTRAFLGTPMVPRTFATDHAPPAQKVTIDPAREDLIDMITHVDPWQTAFLDSQIYGTGIVRSQWLQGGTTTTSATPGLFMRPGRVIGVDNPLGAAMQQVARQAADATFAALALEPVPLSDLKIGMEFSPIDRALEFVS